MIKHRDSHLDHALTEEQIAHLLTTFADRTAFFIETIELPLEFGVVPCGLYGPTMGDPAIADSEVTLAPRPPRTWDSRLVDRPARLVRQVTVIAGPYEQECDPAHHWPRQCILCDGTGKVAHACVLYTAFGGPSAPQEPGDPGCKDPETSAAFWREHALAR